ncbi:GntR family transcriptional regulator [Paenibacillus silvisoli]|uniref:GntR family transcriptional regulator n=1 Tax=Paenibacillus silvisoli TaxID=3110539 RepID=UPI002805E8E2|nr:GntR family transcriptional regulator [Paenibacillus silvisoli]
MTTRESMPLYRFIVEDLKAKISSGHLKDGDAIPNQIELAKLYETSEITSRRALSELVNEGFVVRVRGKGSFVQLRDPSSFDGAEQTGLKQVVLIHPTASAHVFNQPFYASLISGIHAACEEHGIGFQLLDASDSQAIEENRNRRIGTIVLPSPENASAELNVPAARLQAWKEAGLPVVLALPYAPQLQLPCVTVDELTQGYLATEHLLSLGHERIGILLTGQSHLNIKQSFSLRLQGYKLALSRHGIPFDESLVSVMTAGDEPEEELGFRGAKQLLTLETNKPTAIFAANDYIAFGAIRAGKELGLRMPDELSIVGCDDVIQSRYTSPALTTINPNTELVGKRSVERLIQASDEERLQQLSVKEEIAPKLILRGSTAAWPSL